MNKNIVNYTLSGEVCVHGLYSVDNLAEIKARSAVIIASRLFYDKQEWKALRSYVASTVYSISEYWYRRNMCKIDFFVDDLCMANQLNQMNSTVKGGFELLVNETHFVKVTYSIKLDVCMKSKSDLTRDPEIEPNFVWINLFKKLDYAIKDLAKPFSANAVDAVVAADIRKSPLANLT